MPRFPSTDARLYRVLEVRRPGATPVAYRVGASGLVAAPVTGDADAIIFGEDIAVLAVLRGHVAPLQAGREGQIELWGTPEDVAWITRHLARTVVSRAA
jgi:hypothetical protein